ncbi:hypothetical protein [Methanomassiliicoccus luminyensis]|jgi:hypothetical protein|uniref:hypothetical protein n=1 Tax=Methanomassiliicoccus luminyensis TaxID=1080712 RepID=UPI00035F30C1|nr:hypothetical protein [Methanomassiliicoccus luminyensis]
MTKRKTDHSKDMASGSFGAEVVFRCPDIRKEVFSGKMHELMMGVAKRVEAERGALLGHAKMFVETGGGFLKLSVVDTTLGVEAIHELKADTISEGKIRIMAVAIGMKDGVIEEIVKDEVSRLSPVVLCDIQEHDHICDHHHEHGHECKCARRRRGPGPAS